MKWYAALSLCATIALAAEASAAGPYHLDLSIDLPVLGLGLAGTAINFVELPPAACLPDCSPDRINAFDRAVIGNYSESAHTAADYLVIGLLLAPLAADLLDSGGDGFIEDTIVAAETILITQALTQLTKVAVRRTAPFVYDPRVPLETRTESRDATRSFFSGHTATAFAAASSYATTFWLRHPDSRARWLVIAVGAVLAGAVGLLKIEAGYHYWTDIAAGALVGASLGVMIPLLHAEI